MTVDLSENGASRLDEGRGGGIFLRCHEREKYNINCWNQITAPKSKNIVYLHLPQSWVPWDGFSGELRLVRITHCSTEKLAGCTEAYSCQTRKKENKTEPVVVLNLNFLRSIFLYCEKVSSKRSW